MNILDVFLLGEIKTIIDYFQKETRFSVVDYYVENRNWLLVELRTIESSIRLKIKLLS